MEKLTKWLQWVDDNILKILVIGYIFIIPLYPKLPLFNVNYTYVAIRLEDLYVGVTALIFVIQFLRRKATVSWKFFAAFAAFWVAVFISYFYGYYVQKTIPIENKFIGLLHSFRRVEYMSMFFVAMAAVKDKKDFLLYLRTMFIVLGIVGFYAMGQVFLGWPAVQTMNPEYAKGYFLVLDAAARVSSTFAGHYDLAAYLVILMPISLGLYITSESKKYFFVFVLALATLVLTASRVSYGAFLISTTLYLLYSRKFKLLVVVLVLTAILTPLSGNLTSRITRSFQFTKVYIDTTTGEAIVPRENSPDVLPPGDYTGKIDPNKAQQTTNNDTSKEAIAAKKELRNTILKKAEQQGQSLNAEELDMLVQEQFRGYISQNKLLPDVSQSIRFQVEWPRAIAAFMRNPVLGKGPSSITEATDNDYLRWLGEFGLLGTTLFLTVLFMIGKKVWDTARNVSKAESYLYYGFLFGFFGLLINATYIDVFEASKVAYTFWLLAGLFVATYKFTTAPVVANQKVKKNGKK